MIKKIFLEKDIKYRGERLDRQRTNLNNLLKDLKDDENITYFENQQIATWDLLYNMSQTGQIFHLVIAQPGSGKSGMKDFLMYNLRTHLDNNYIIYGDRISMMTGLSSKDWVNDSRKRFNFLPDIDKKTKGTCYHRNTINKRIEYLLEHSDLLYKHIFIFDEAHIACLKGQTIDKELFIKLKLTKQKMKELKIKIIFVSATPDILELDLKVAPDFTTPIILEPGKYYRGLQYFLDNNKIIDIRKKENMKSDDYIELIIDYLKKCKKPYNHIIRCRSTPDGRYPKLKKKIELNNFIVKEYNQTNRFDFQSEINKSPLKTTIYLIKSMFTASQRLTVNINIKYIIEIPSKNRDDTVTSQGLIGRFCEHSEDTSKYQNIKFIADLSAIESYLQYMNRKINYDQYQSRNIKHSQIRGNKKSTIHDQLDLRQTLSDVKYTYREFYTYEEAYNFVYLHKNSKITKINNKDCNNFIQNTLRGITKVMSFEELDLGWGLSKISTYRYHVCYSNTSDINSVRHIITYNKSFRIL